MSSCSSQSTEALLTAQKQQQKRLGFHHHLPTYSFITIPACQELNQIGPFCPGTTFSCVILDFSPPNKAARELCQPYHVAAPSPESQVVFDLLGISFVLSRTGFRGSSQGVKVLPNGTDKQVSCFPHTFPEPPPTKPWLGVRWGQLIDCDHTCFTAYMTGMPWILQHFHSHS